MIANWGDKCQFNRQYWPVLTPSIIWFVIWRWLKFAFEEFTLQPPLWNWLHWEAVKWCARVMLDKCAGEWSVLIHTPSSKQTKVQNIRLVILFWPFCRPTAANPLHELSVFSKVFLSAEQLTAIYLIFIEFRWLHCTDNRQQTAPQRMVLSCWYHQTNIKQEALCFISMHAISVFVL